MRSIRATGQNAALASIAISRLAYPVAAAEVFLVAENRSESALMAGALGRGPVLVVPPCSGDADEAPPEIAEEILRLTPETVTVVGSRSELCEALVSQVVGSVPTQRAEGDTPTEVSLALSSLGWKSAEEVYIASTPLSGGALPAGSLNRGPVLFVPSGGSAPSEVVERVAQLEPSQIVALGNPAELPEQEMDRLAGDHPWLRLTGQNETAAAVAISQHRYPSLSDDTNDAAYADTVYLSATTDAGVALGAAASGASDGPVLPVPSECQPLPAELTEEITRLRPGRVVAVGDTETVCEVQLDQASRAADVPAVIREGVLVLDGPQQSSLTSVTDAELRFEASTVPPEIFAGTVVVASEPTANAPMGLLRRVVAVDTEDAETVVTTEPATVSDAVIDGRGSAHELLTATTAADHSGRALHGQGAATRMLPQAGPVDTDLSLTVTLDNEVLYDPGDPEGRFTISGTITVGVVFTADLDVRGGKVRRFLVRAEVYNDTDLTFTAGVSATLREAVKTLAQRNLRPVTFWIGPIPIVLTPALVIEAGIEATTTTMITTGFEQASSYEVALEYVDGRGWNTTSRTRAPDPITQKPPVGTEFEVLGRVTASIETLIYSAVGPVMSADTYLKALGQLPGPPQASLTYGLRGRASATARIPVVDIDLGEFEAQLFNIERPLWQWPEAVPAPAGERRFRLPLGGVHKDCRNGDSQDDFDMPPADMTEVTLAYAEDGNITVGVRVRQTITTGRWNPPLDELDDPRDHSFSALVIFWYADDANGRNIFNVHWRSTESDGNPAPIASLYSRSSGGPLPATESIDETYYRVTFPASSVGDPAAIAITAVGVTLSDRKGSCFYRDSLPVEWKTDFVSRPAAADASMAAQGRTPVGDGASETQGMPPNPLF